MIASDDAQLLDFYEQVLGLKRMLDEYTPYENTTGSRTIFGLEPGEGFHMVDFDDPRSGHSLGERRSGKLKCVRFAAGARIADLRDRSRAGSLGYSLYSWRVHNIEAMWKRVAAAGASAVSDVCEDEFGTRAFSFNAPDGYHCLLLQA
jgi:catechol 2,3-dioxygenase-like lactoylglutathione lyase family enzyme